MIKKKSSEICWLLCLFILSFMISCTSCYNDNTKDKVLITAILTPDYHRDLGYPNGLEKNVYRANVVVAYYQKKFVTDATVLISSDSQQVYLRRFDTYDVGYQINTTYYVDTANALKVTPGKTYNLKVELSDGRVFTSHTTIPQNPIIQYPANNSVLEVDISNEYGKIIGHFPFVYIKDPSTYVQFLTQEDSLGITTHSYSISPFDSLGIVFKNDSLVQRTVHLCTLDSSFSKHAWRLTKFAFTADSEYSELYQKYSALYPIEESSNIVGEGGVGIFGSYGHTAVQFYIRRKQ